MCFDPVSATVLASTAAATATPALAAAGGAAVSGAAAAAATSATLATASTAATLGTIANVVSVGGTILSTIGAFNQASAAKDQAAFQAGVSRNNKIIADRKAAREIKLGELEANRKKLLTKQFSAKQLVSLASQGVDVTEGSSIDLLSDTAAAGAFDQEIIRFNAAERAQALTEQGAGFGTQATLSQAVSSSQAPLLSAGTTFLSEGGQVASRWYKNAA